MTTATEVRTWLRPLLNQRSDLVLVGRNLVLAPLRHVVRGIYFDGSSDKHACRPKWYVNRLCNHHGERSGFSFQYWGDLFLKRTDDPDFIVDLYAKLHAALELDFSEVLTLQDYLKKTNPNTLNGDVFIRRALSETPLGYAIVLAALGRVSEARQVFRPAVESLERSSKSHLAMAEAEFAKRSNSAIGKLNLEWAERDSRALAKLRPFAELLERGDRVGIASVLCQWEAETARGWGLDHLWEPTPFPIELGAGD